MATPVLRPMAHGWPVPARPAVAVSFSRYTQQHARVRRTSWLPILGMAVTWRRSSPPCPMPRASIPRSTGVPLPPPSSFWHMASWTSLRRGSGGDAANPRQQRPPKRQGRGPRRNGAPRPDRDGTGRPADQSVSSARSRASPVMKSSSIPANIASILRRAEGDPKC